MKKLVGHVLTIGELAIYLKIPKSTLYKLAREGKVPSVKIGRHWRFLKNAIDNWLVREKTSNPNCKESGDGAHKNGAGKNDHRNRRL